jgi:hypothetical protein
MRKMMRKQSSAVRMALVILTTLALAGASMTSAQAANKTITCYKGTLVKKVTAAKPKCPTGYSTKKPVAPVTKAPVAPTASKVQPFNGTYKVKISLLWGETDVRATTVTGAGTGDVLGLTDLVGTGYSAPMNQCDGFDGTGTLSGGGSSLKLAFDTSAQGCAEDANAPTTITIKGNAKILSGTGKYAGATGTLAVKGSFSIRSTAIGSSEVISATLTATGNVTTK